MDAGVFFGPCVSWRHACGTPPHAWTSESAGAHSVGWVPVVARIAAPSGFVAVPTILHPNMQSIVLCPIVASQPCSIIGKRRFWVAGDCVTRLCKLIETQILFDRPSCGLCRKPFSEFIYFPHRVLVFEIVLVEIERYD